MFIRKGYDEDVNSMHGNGTDDDIISVHGVGGDDDVQSRYAGMQLCHCVGMQVLYSHYHYNQTSC